MMNEEELRKTEIIIEKLQQLSDTCSECRFCGRCFFGFECLSNNYSCFKPNKNNYEIFTIKSGTITILGG